MHPVVENITALIFTEPHVIPVREPERDLVNNANPASRGDTRHLSALLQDEVSVNHVGARPYGVNLPQVLRDMGFAGGNSNQHGFSNT